MSPLLHRYGLVAVAAGQCDVLSLLPLARRNGSCSTRETAFIFCVVQAVRDGEAAKTLAWWACEQSSVTTGGCAHDSLQS